eukprot:1555804-Amphidinium_carterae.1
MLELGGGAEDSLAQLLLLHSCCHKAVVLREVGNLLWRAYKHCLLPDLANPAKSPKSKNGHIKWGKIK